MIANILRSVVDMLTALLSTSHSHYAVFRINEKTTKASFFASTEDRPLSLKKADILNQFTCAGYKAVYIGKNNGT